jgi:hypothetical protein
MQTTGIDIAYDTHEQEHTYAHLHLAGMCVFRRDQLDG